MSNPTELPDLADAVRKLVKAKGRFHTEQNYKELADALARYDARRAQPEGEAPQAARGSFAEFMHPNVDDLAATLSPLCGAQHAESGKERGSIGDLAEFHIVLDWYDNEASYGSINEGRNKLAEYIDKWADRRAAQLDGGKEGSAT